jgi:hypothetical protein
LEFVMFVPFSFPPALPLACALLALAGMTSRAEASEREEATSAALAFPLAPSTTDARLPTNIAIPSTLAPLLREMLILSPTFRRQCARIAQASQGRVQITIRRPRSFQVRAASVIQRGQAGAWTATVEVFINNDLPEMLAHELEHVIEHIDGVDLPRLAQQGLEGVRASSDELYETARAVAAGKRVASEVAAGRNPGARASGRSAS